MIGHSSRPAEMVARRLRARHRLADCLPGQVKLAADPPDRPTLDQMLLANEFHVDHREQNPVSLPGCIVASTGRLIVSGWSTFRRALPLRVVNFYVSDHKDLPNVSLRYAIQYAREEAYQEAMEYAMADWQRVERGKRSITEAPTIGIQIKGTLSLNG